MSYRNLSLNGRGYEYTIGKKCTHVRGLGTFLNSDIGAKLPIFNHQPGVSERCPVLVTPACVAAAIKDNIATIETGAVPAPNAPNMHQCFSTV